MSAPPTLVLGGDDERTIVDRREPESRPPPERDKSLQQQAIAHGAKLLRNWWRPLVASVAGGGLCLSIITIALHQRRLSERLQRTIDAMHTTALPLDSVDMALTPASQGPPASAFTERHAPRVDAQTVGRDDLELQAATFVVANDYRAALDSYRVLAERFPEERSFSDLVTILRAKVACRGARGAEVLACD